jgi:hypothetical protein
MERGGRGNAYSRITEETICGRGRRSRYGERRASDSSKINCAGGMSQGHCVHHSILGLVLTVRTVLERASTERAGGGTVSIGDTDARTPLLLLVLLRGLVLGRSFGGVVAQSGRGLDSRSSIRILVC